MEIAQHRVPAGVVVCVEFGFDYDDIAPAALGERKGHVAQSVVGGGPAVTHNFERYINKDCRKKDESE